MIAWIVWKAVVRRYHEKYVYEELAIKAIVSALDRMKVEGITQAENLVKVAAILNAGEIIERKRRREG